MTQAQRIIDYIKRFGSITPMEAFFDLSITKLATRVSEMKKDGIKFDQEYCQTKNRFGEPVYYMKYRLRDENEGQT